MARDVVFRVDLVGSDFKVRTYFFIELRALLGIYVPDLVFRHQFPA